MLGLKKAARGGVLLPLALLACLSPILPGAEPGGRLKLLCSTFPVYQITRNVAAGSDGVAIDLMIPAAMGCPHDYGLTPGDMRKLEAAEVLLVNGLGMEEFLGAPVERANSNLIVIDSSAGIEDLLEYDDDHHDEDADDDHHDGEHADGDDDDHHDGEHAEGEKDGHRHEGVNSHLFVSPILSARMAEHIAAELARLDPANADKYAANARSYREAMDRLTEDGRAVVARLGNRRMIQPHGAFDYLARDLGLEIVGVLQPHGEDLSASGMLALLETIRREKPGAVFIEPQYSDRTGRLVAAETGIGMYSLDPVASGPNDAPLDYYESVMRKNLAVLTEALGGK